ncbi:NAD(P)/FAD-dependent oxidoreductase [Aquibacillus koreensis]|uniref:NAD(P)/FAD-dependent oxidoreductase n=1 Tax=Aquibacillus koreensis TaxID=279446 RepID=A0A9X3WNP2_9BACI|nr:NAD(P)/FAD-dependent oxidoreductase [Aquibacillus koreensis]MCT2536143.1 NAD(P)/FAD-dependent oxidoreductase [Aquibacillus koreensis]MDC3422068.1 NAD(P)/FAD-dependent oxidoreductase [Aquibacillus koreensis]
MYGVRGGTYTIVEAFEKLARELGVQIITNTDVNHIVIEGKKAIGVDTIKGFIAGDEIIANIDALTVYEKMLPKSKRNKWTKREPSVSGYAMLLGVNKQYDQLVHHNVFFPENYQDEFISIFDRGEMPDDPTIYICYSGYSDPTMTKKQTSNLFVLVNAPYINEKTDWEQLREPLMEKILQKLEEKGLVDLRENIAYIQTMTPADIKRNTGAYQGAIYGMSSNNIQQAFSRIPNKANDYDHLWFVGGTAHPGGGTPIVTLSGKLVAEEIIRRYKK